MYQPLIPTVVRSTGSESPLRELVNITVASEVHTTVHSCAFSEAVKAMDPTTKTLPTAIYGDAEQTRSYKVSAILTSAELVLV